MPLRPATSAFLTSSVFVALCAAALGWETSLIAGTARLPLSFYAFIFVATWLAYRLHRLPDASRKSRAAILLNGAIAGGLMLSLPMRMWPWFGAAAAVAIAYALPALPGGRRLREFGIAKITSLAGVWTLVTTYLPLQEQHLPADQMMFLLARRFLFVFALCLAFDERDHVRDARDGIRTLVVRLGPAGSFALMRGTLLLFAILIVSTPLATAHPLGAPLTVALLTSALMTWIAIEWSRRLGSHRLYHLGCVDGMMALQTALVALATFTSGQA